MMWQQCTLFICAACAIIWASLSRISDCLVRSCSRVNSMTCVGDAIYWQAIVWCLILAVHKHHTQKHGRSERLCDGALSEMTLLSNIQVHTHALNRTQAQFFFFVSHLLAQSASKA